MNSFNHSQVVAIRGYQGLWIIQLCPGDAMYANNKYRCATSMYYVTQFPVSYTRTSFFENEAEEKFVKVDITPILELCEKLAKFPKEMR